ncbi:hypothetical protein GCM10023156_07220 [Novipirellula rosea]|uniref:Type I restriction modification DNA specificity domain-containing protein n=1 Tax=Novipirellula rosea TaxID=1031540 RepID=A0ABP8MBQ3_9BACT
MQTGDIKAAQLYLSTYSQSYSEAGLAQSKKWPVGTLCITIAANIAETAILDMDACFPDSVIGFVADERESDVRFVKYKLDLVKQTFKRVSQGAAQDNLSQQKLVSIPLSVPSVTEQRRIADILSTYDDLIENNRRRMELLEASGRQLYEEWFVRLRFPGYEHTKICNGVPNGWERRNLSQVCVAGNGIQTGPFGSQLHQADYTEEGFPVVMPKDISGTQISTSTIARVPEEITERLSKHRLQDGDIVLARRGDIGRKCLITEREKGWLCGTGCMRLRTDRTIISPRMLFNILGRDDVSGELKARAGGSIMPNLNLTILSNISVVVPPANLQTVFDALVEPTHRQISTLDAQNQQLRLARDILLPRLMNGDVPV